MWAKNIYGKSSTPTYTFFTGEIIRINDIAKEISLRDRLLVKNSEYFW